MDGKHVSGFFIFLGNSQTGCGIMGVLRNISNGDRIDLSGFAFGKKLLAYTK